MHPSDPSNRQRLYWIRGAKWALLGASLFIVSSVVTTLLQKSTLSQARANFRYESPSWCRFLPRILRSSFQRPVSVEFRGHVNSKTISVLAEIETLKVIDLSKQPVSDADLATLATLPGLETLVVTDPGITDRGLESLRNVRTLRALDVEGTSITLAGLADLERSIGVTGLVERRAAADLRPFTKSIYIRPLSQWQPVRPPLDSLSISVGDFSKKRVFTAEQLQALSHLKCLLSLNIAHTVEPKVLEWVGAMPELKEFSWSPGPQISSEDMNRSVELLSASKSLESLEIRFSPMTDDCFPSIARLKTLRSLTLTSASNLKFDQVHLLENLSELTNLELGGSLEWGWIEDTRRRRRRDFSECIAFEQALGWRGLSALKSLRLLRLEGVPISDEGLSYIAENPNIVSLDVSSCKAVTDEGIRYLTHMPNLQYLSLSNCSLTVQVFESLAKMPKLKKLNLYMPDHPEIEAAREQFAKAHTHMQVNKSGLTKGELELIFRPVTHRP